MRKFRLTAAFLALCFSFGLIGCQETDDEPTVTDAVTTTELPVETKPALELPERDYGGDTIVYLAAEPYTANFHLIIEEENGDTLNDAGYKRARAVSDLLNVEFDKYEVPVSSLASTLDSSVMSGEGAFTFVLPHANEGLTRMVSGGSLLDWKTLEYVNFDKPWWNSEMQESISVAGKMFWASGDITMTWQGFGAIVFNKDFLTDYNIAEDPYELVWNGEWTLDKMYSMISGIGKDLNGDTEMTEEDQYGLLAHGDAGTSIGWLFGADQHITTKDADGCPVLDMQNDRMMGIVEKFYNLMNSPDTFLDGFYTSTYMDSTYRSMLIGGRSFLTWMDIGSMHSALREIEFDFGILPMPKYDKEQEKYYSVSSAGIIGIPADADAERAGIVAEALAYYSYEYIRPAFFDIVLQNKAVQDEDSYRILTMLHENRRFDFAYNFVGSPAAYNILGKVVLGNKGTDFVSYYDSIKDSVNQGLRSIYDAVSEQ